MTKEVMTIAGKYAAARDATIHNIVLSKNERNSLLTSYWHAAVEALVETGLTTSEAKTALRH